MKTTLNTIRSHLPCAGGWSKLLKHLGKTQADDEPVSIITVLDSNGIDDALWCLRAVIGHDREIRLYAVWCARQVQHLMTDPRSLVALDVAERFANGEATDEERAAAEASAEAASGAASWAASWASAGAASWAASLASAAAAAEASAGAASWASSWADARATQAAELRRVCEALEGRLA